MANTTDTSTVRADVINTTNTWTNEALSFLNVLSNNAAELVTVDLPSVNTPQPGTPFESTLFGRIGVEPVAPANAIFTPPTSDPGSTVSSTAVIQPALVQIPNDTSAAPQIELPAKPDIDETIVTPTAPVPEDVSVPSAPTLELPVAPTLAAVVFPDTPNLNLPTFEEAAPSTPASFLLTSDFEYQDDVHDRPLLDAIRGKLLTDVNEGGYGIEPDDENALYARARDREYTQLDAAEAEAEERFASRGFSLPPGAMNAALTRLRAEAEDRISEAEREIAVNRADLFRKNREFSMNQGTEVENVRLQHFGFAMERALNAKRFAAEYAINVHDAHIRQFNAELQRYSTVAEVYRTRLQGALTQIQIYEAEVRAAVAKQQANQVDVDLYRALLEAATTRIDLFQAQVRAASLVAELQRLKVDVYRTEVQAFAARVDSNKVQLDVYEAGIRGELAKVDVFRTEVGAYTERVRAAGIEQSARNERSQVLIQAKRAEIDEYQARLQRYETQVRAETARVGALLEKHRNDVTTYSSALQGYEALARVDLRESEVQIQAIQEETKRLQTNAQLSLEAATKTLETRFAAANAGAQIAGSALNAAASTLQAIIVEQESTTT